MSDLKTKIARDFSTPCVVIDMDRVERNISRTQSLCDAAGVRNRPHIKTHKSPFLARMQVEAGASGVTCQKIGEAEVMANGGLNDILIAYNLLGEEKMARLGRLHERVDVTVAADNLTVIDGLSQAGEIAGRPLGVVIECDTGRKRAGVETAGEAIALAREVAKRPHLDFRGLMFYPTEKSWPETQAFLNEVKKGLQPDGLAEKIRIVSTGGSPNLANLGKLAGATEHRAGTSIFNDRMQMAAGVASLDDCALMVYATVVSRAGPERGILDSGSKTLTSDSGGLDGYGTHSGTSAGADRRILRRARQSRSRRRQRQAEGRRCRADRAESCLRRGQHGRSSRDGQGRRDRRRIAGRGARTSDLTHRRAAPKARACWLWSK